MDHHSDVPFTCWPHCRTGSPLGGSILMISAPRSASRRVQNGAATKCPISSIRSPDSIPLGISFGILASLWLSQCLLVYSVEFSSTLCALYMKHRQRGGPFLSQQGRLRV